MTVWDCADGSLGGAEEGGVVWWRCQLETADTGDRYVWMCESVRYAGACVARLYLYVYIERAKELITRQTYKRTQQCEMFACVCCVSG